MKFDVIIIGGGLSGLVCGIKLQEQGMRTAIVSSGQSALHFFSGSFDLLGGLPEGVEACGDVWTHINSLEANHPYKLMGLDNVRKYVTESPAFFERCDIMVHCETDGQNHVRLSPLGAFMNAWLSLYDFPLWTDTESLSYKKVVIATFEGFLDFYPQFLADALKDIGVSCRIVEISMSSVDKLRENPTEMRSSNIARVFENKRNIDALCELLKNHIDDADAVFLPAVFGLSSSEPVTQLKRGLPVEICLVPTMPPSVPGIRTQQSLKHRYQKLGGQFMMGDNVVDADIEKEHVKLVFTANHGDIEMCADSYVLATGSFFSKGIVADMDKVYEPVFNLDVDYDIKRERWYSKDLFSKQPYMSFGVKVNKDFHPFINGITMPDLYAIGSVLSGYDASHEACGGGVAIFSAMYVADMILKQRNYGK